MSKSAEIPSPTSLHTEGQAVPFFREHNTPPQNKNHHMNVGELGAQLLSGEKVIDSYSCKFSFKSMAIRSKTGKLFLTNYRVCFATPSDYGMVICEYSSAPNTSLHHLGVFDPVSSTSGLGERFNNFLSGSATISIRSKPTQKYGIEVRTKDLKRMRFSFTTSMDRDKALKQMQQNCFFSDPMKSFAFAHCTTKDEFASLRSSDWIYDPSKEFNRISFETIAPGKFVLSDVNTDYSVCDSYPMRFVLPASVDLPTIKSSAAFRGSNRLPAVSWIHPENGATISRCSQPQVGIRGQRDSGDEALVRAIFSANPKFTVADKSMYIIDARPQSAAYANHIKGAGYENTAYYENTKLVFMNIQNIHTMRTSFKQLCDLCCRETGEIPDRVTFESTKWLDHVQLLLKAAVQLARLMNDEGRSLLVHCSDGWDRTPQLVSLVQLLLDPFYRTIAGFCVLIQKEWLAFGHKFAHRLGAGLAEDASMEISPIFVQWIDAVSQIVSQLPNSFEFTEAFLISLAHSNQFGTFLFNSERERKAKVVDEVTHSLWSYYEKNLGSQSQDFLSNNATPTGNLLDPIKESSPLFTNPNYVFTNSQLMPIVSTSKLQIWDLYYQRWNIKFKQLHEQQLQTQAQLRRAACLHEELATLKQNLEELKNERKLFRAAFEAALSHDSHISEQLRSDLNRLKNMSEAERKNYEVQFYIRDGTVVNCRVKEDHDTTTTKFVPNLERCAIDDYVQDTEIDSNDFMDASVLVRSPYRYDRRRESIEVDGLEDSFEMVEPELSVEAELQEPRRSPIQIVTLGYDQLSKWLWSALGGN